MFSGKDLRKSSLRQVCGAGVSPAWFNHNILGRRDARTTIIRKPGGEPVNLIRSRRKMDRTPEFAGFLHPLTENGQIG